MKWANQNKWMIYCLLWVLPFFAFAGDGGLPSSGLKDSCRGFFAKLIEPFQFRQPMHRIAELDQVTIKQHTSAIASNGKPIEQDLLVFKVPHLFDRYTSARGLFLYAKVYVNGDIRRARKKVKDFLPVSEFHKLKWPRDNLPMWNINHSYSWEVFMEGEWVFRGMEGYALVADLYFDGDMAKAFDDTLAKSGLFAQEFTTRFGWKRFYAHTLHFYPLRRKITTTEGKINKMKYKYELGLNNMASEFYGGDTVKTVIDINLVLSNKEFEDLFWPTEKELRARTKMRHMEHVF